MKPGWKTTEFWVVAITGVLTFLRGFGTLPETFPHDAAVGFVTSGAALIAYVISRGWVKAQTP